jgi:hypothetical protein
MRDERRIIWRSAMRVFDTERELSEALDAVSKKRWYPSDHGIVLLKEMAWEV